MLHIGTQVLAEGETSGMNGALTLVAETGQGRLGASVPAQRGVPAERLGLAAAESLRLDLESGAALDSQVFMSVRPSRPKRTDHPLGGWRSQ